MAHRLLLDTSSLLYRAFFALPTSITARDGRPVNAVRGYLDMTAALVRDHRPDQLAHVFDDDWRPAARVRAYAGYKADRPADPDDLPWQFELLAEVLEALGQTRVDAPGWEADDALGALCAAAPGDRCDVVTGDRDLLQLVRDPDPGGDGGAVRVLFPVRGVSQLTTFDAAEVRRRYGVPPARYADFAILRGDPSDGLPGVRGVGEKTAARLVAEHGSLAALLDAADRQPPRLAASLRQAVGYLRAMAAVVPVRSDVALRTTAGERRDEALARLAERYNLDGPLSRLRAALDG